MVCGGCFVWSSSDVYVDIAQEYAFARSDHRLEQHDFEPTFHKAAIAGSTSGALIKQYPWILPIMTSMPDALMTWLDPNMASYFRLQSVSNHGATLLEKSANIIIRISESRYGK
jgi:hypothetical protein